MPLLECPECDRPISAAAQSCPSCGAPGLGVVLAAHRQRRRDLIWAALTLPVAASAFLGLACQDTTLFAVGFIGSALLLLIRFLGLFAVLALIGVGVLLLSGT